MKVCLVYEFLTEYGGIERLLVNNVRMLKKLGLEVEILTCHYDEKVLKTMGFEDIKVTNISSIKTPYESLSLISCFLGFNKLKEIKTDFFISYSAPANFLIRKIKKPKADFLNHFPRWLYFTGKERLDWATSTQGIKRTLVFILSLFFNNKLKKIDKELVKKNSLLFANSEYTKNKVDSVYKIDSQISYPPIDPVFKPHKETIKEKFIFYTGRIIPDKKFDWLIEACSHMKTKTPLYLSGQGDRTYTQKLKELADRKGVKVVFLGRLSTEDLVKYYSSAQIVPFPVPACDYGLITIESLSCGTPLVSWDDGAGPTEQIKDGDNGYLAKPYDLKDFAAKMDKAINTNLKKRNRKKILKSAEKFSYESVEKSFLKDIKNNFLNSLHR